MDRDDLSRRLISALQPLDPEKVILFGSYARNEADEESDVDLYIASKENFIPATFAENMLHYKKYTRVLKELKRLVPMDVIVHTRPMNQMFEDGNSAFSREILRTGERLL